MGFSLLQASATVTPWATPHRDRTPATPTTGAPSETSSTRRRPQICRVSLFFSRSRFHISLYVKWVRFLCHMRTRNQPPWNNWFSLSWCGMCRSRCWTSDCVFAAAKCAPLFLHQGAARGLAQHGARPQGVLPHLGHRVPHLLVHLQIFR